MGILFTREIAEELNDVDIVFKKRLEPWWDNISVYNNKLSDDNTFQVLPAVVLSVYKYFGLNNNLSIAMASIFKTIYFSNSIHAMVMDDEEGQKHNQELQFNILIGDYIFGAVLKLLVETGVSNLLGILSDMMCTLNEGRTLQFKMNVDRKEFIRKTKAPLYAAVFQTAAYLSDLEPSKEQLYNEIGYNLGMCIESFNNLNFTQDAKEYIHKTELMLGWFNNERKLSGSSLGIIIDDLHEKICNIEKVAVV